MTYRNIKNIADSRKECLTYFTVRIYVILFSIFDTTSLKSLYLRHRWSLILNNIETSLKHATPIRNFCKESSNNKFQWFRRTITTEFLNKCKISLSLIGIIFILMPEFIIKPSPTHPTKRINSFSRISYLKYGECSPYQKNLTYLINRTELNELRISNTTRRVFI